MLVDVSKKIILITGSSRGIGSELAKVFAKENAKVIINYFNSENEVNILYEEIKEYNQDCIKIKADITNPSDVSYMYREMINKYGYIDVLINNAGVCNDNLIQMMQLSQWQKVIDVNLTGIFLCCREFSKIMIKQGYGKIINIASLKAQKGSIGQVNYTSSKAGVIALTKSLAKELGQYNISVNAICPGFIVTDLNRHDQKKKEIAEKESSLPIESLLNVLLDFVVYISSDNFFNVSGRVFNLDSRIK